MTANLRVLTSACTDLMSSLYNDLPQVLTLCCDSMNIKIVQVVPYTFLVVTVTKNALQDKVAIAVDAATNLLQKLNQMISNTSTNKTMMY